MQRSPKAMLPPPTQMLIFRNTIVTSQPWNRLGGGHAWLMIRIISLNRTCLGAHSVLLGGTAEMYLENLHPILLHTLHNLYLL